jgi:hypothetical protein
VGGGGGANDISKQNSLEALKQFEKKCQDVNVTVMTAPMTHDLMPSSCVNSEVVRFSRLLKERMKLYTKIKILDTDLNRDCFTKHCLHMNSSGKDQLIMKLVEMIENITVQNSGSNIELQWKCENQVSKYDEGEVSNPQLNKRQRKNPALKDRDFLW